MAHEIKEEQEKLREQEQKKADDAIAKQPKKCSLLLSLKDGGFASLPRVLKIIDAHHGQVTVTNFN